jgi:lipid-A-disaccharide synthase
LLSAGEASGDAYGAALVRELREILAGDGSFSAIGGPLLRAEGVEIIFDSSQAAAMGALEAAKQIVRYSRSIPGIKRRFQSGKPGWFIPIDFGFINIRLARTAKRAGWKVLYFIPPGSYRRGPQGKDLATLTDIVVTPFPWSEKILRENGVNAHFLGHPLKQLLGPAPDHVSRSGWVVLPGSRPMELRLNLPFLSSVLSVTHANTPVTFALAPNADLEAVRRAWSACAGGRSDRLVVGDTTALLRAAEFGIVCSGTATLQAALTNTPHVIFYRVPRAMDIQGKVMNINPKFIGLPNILLDRLAVLEFTLRETDPTEVIAAVKNLPYTAKDQVQSFSELNALLGPDDAITATAKLLKAALVP